MFITVLSTVLRRVVVRVYVSVRGNVTRLTVTTIWHKDVLLLVLDAGSVLAAELVVYVRVGELEV